MTSLDDTQPRSPFKQPVEKPPLNAYPPEEPPDESGPGCLMWGIFGTMALGFSILIVVLAGTAGWTTGEREANRLATATQSALISAQLQFIPGEVEERNEYLLNLRLTYLQAVAPQMDILPALRETATTVHLMNLPTATPPPTETPIFTPTIEAPLVEVTAEITEVVEPVITASSSGQYDLAGLLQEARVQIGQGQYEEAYETLDVIIRVDPTFQSNVVRGLMLEALTTLANRLYASTDTLAEAIRWTDVAEEYGAIGNLSYERTLAGLYLDYQRAAGAGDFTNAVRSLNEMRSYQSEYKGLNLNRTLFDSYVRFGDNYSNYGQEYCRAVTQYNAALNIFADSLVEGKRDTAQQLCEQQALLTLTPAGFVTPEGEAVPTAAPIGG